MQPSSTELLLERLLLLTLSLDEAARGDDPTAIGTLLTARANLLEELQGHKLGPECQDMLGRVMQEEQRVVRMLQAEQTHALGQLVNSYNGRRGVKAYRRSVGSTGASRAA